MVIWVNNEDSELVTLASAEIEQPVVGYSLYVLMKVPDWACTGKTYSFDLGIACDTWLCGPNIKGDSLTHEYIIDCEGERCDYPDTCGAEGSAGETTLADVVDFFAWYAMLIGYVAVILTVVTMISGGL